MALVVEDGSEVSGANSYVTVTEANDWFASVNDSEWAALADAEKERHLIMAAGHVDSENIYPLSGTRGTVTQALSWPRDNATYQNGGPDVPANAIPNDVKRAQIVAAGQSRKGLLPTGGTAATGGQETKKEAVDGAVTIEYFHSTQGLSSGATQEDYERYADPLVKGYLHPLLRADATVSPSDGTFVARSDAAKRSTWYTPTSTEPAFSRGMFDATPQAEDRELIDRE